MGRGGARPGAGRKSGVTIPTYVTRVPSDVDKELIDNLPQLKDLLNYWEEEIRANLPTRTSNPRYWKAKQMLDEIRALGY